MRYRDNRFQGNYYRNVGCREKENYNSKCDEKKQKHVHEIQGSVKMVDNRESHNHRFATVSGEAIPCGGNDHIHEVYFRTDTFGDHYHEFKGKTGGAIQIGDRHVHCIESITTENDGHRHRFEVVTLIENPAERDCKK